MTAVKLALWFVGGSLVLTGVIGLINIAIVKNSGTETIPNPLISAANAIRTQFKSVSP